MGKGLSRQRIQDALASVGAGCYLSDLAPGDEWVINYLTRTCALSITNLPGGPYVEPCTTRPRPPRTQKEPLPDECPF